MARFLVDSEAGQGWWVQVWGPISFRTWTLRNLSVSVRTPFPTSMTSPERKFPFRKEVESQDFWRDWTPFSVSRGNKSFSLSGWIEKDWKEDWEEIEREALEFLRVQVIPDLERSLRFRSKKQVLKPLTEKAKLRKGDLDWIALALLKPRIEIEGEKLGELRFRFFLGQDPWPKGVRPWDLALETFPELWLYLA